MLADLLDLVLPGSCVGCARPGPSLCPLCGAPDLHPVALGSVAVIAAARYEATIRTALLGYKERDRRELCRPLGALLGRAVAELGSAGIVVVPVPSAAAARRARRGDHVLRLARVAARQCRTGVRSPLRLVRPVRDSAGLDVAARAQNLQEAMAARPPAGRAAAVVVDDILTTGATLQEAVRALRAAGWDVAGAAVVAATPRRHPARESHLSRGDTWQVDPVGSNVRLT